MLSLHSSHLLCVSLVVEFQLVRTLYKCLENKLVYLALDGKQSKIGQNIREKVVQ